MESGEHGEMSRRTVGVRLATVEGEGMRASALLYRPGNRAIEEISDCRYRMLMDSRRCFRSVSPEEFEQCKVRSTLVGTRVGLLFRSPR